MPDRYIIAWRDFDNDRREISLPVAAGSDVTSMGGFVANLEAYLLGASGGAGFYDEIAVDPKSKSNNPYAQNKFRMVVEVIDTVTGNTHSYKFPCIDMGVADDGSSNPAFIVSNGVTALNPDHALYAPLKADIEADLLSKDYNPVTLSRIYVEE